MVDVHANFKGHRGSGAMIHLIHANLTQIFMALGSLGAFLSTLVGMRWLWSFFKPKRVIIFERDQAIGQRDIYKETSDGLRGLVEAYRDTTTSLSSRVAGLELSVNQLHVQLNNTSDKLGVAIRYIDDLRAHIAQLRARFEVAVSDMPTPPIPQALKGDLQPSTILKAPTQQ